MTGNGNGSSDGDDTQTRKMNKNKARSAVELLKVAAAVAFFCSISQQ